MRIAHTGLALITALLLALAAVPATPGAAVDGPPGPAELEAEATRIRARLAHLEPMRSTPDPAHDTTVPRGARHHDRDDVRKAPDHPRPPDGDPRPRR